MSDTTTIIRGKWAGLVLGLVLAVGPGAVRGQAPPGGADTPAASELNEKEIKTLVDSLARDFRKGIYQDTSDPPIIEGGPLYALDSRSANAFRKLAEAGPKAKAALPVMKELLEEFCGETGDNPPRRKYPAVTPVTAGVLGDGIRFLGSLGRDAEVAVSALSKALSAPPDGVEIDVNLLLRYTVKSDGLREKAAEALGNVGSPRAVPALTTALAQDDSPSVRTKAAEALGKVGGAKAGTALTTALTRDPSPDVQMTAALVLVTTGDPKGTAAAVERVREMIQNPSGYPAVAAVKTAEEIGKRLPQGERRQDLVTALRVEKSLLGPTDPPEVVKAFEHALAALEADQAAQNEEPRRPPVNPPPRVPEPKDTKAPAVPAAPPSGRGLDRAAVAVLMKALEDADPKVRREAAETLGAAGPAAREAVPALLKALRDPDAGVREAATRGLERLLAPEGKPGDPAPPGPARDGPPAGTPDPAEAELAALRAEKAQLEKDVQHQEEEVLYWRNQVRSDPKSLSAPIALKGAEDALNHYRTKLEVVESRINRLQGTKGNGPGPAPPPGPPPFTPPGDPGQVRPQPDKPGTAGNPYDRDAADYGKLSAQHLNAALGYEKSAEQEARKKTPEGNRWAEYYRDKAKSERAWADYYDGLAKKALERERPR